MQKSYSIDIETVLTVNSNIGTFNGTFMGLRFCDIKAEIFKQFFTLFVIQWHNSNCLNFEFLAYKMIQHSNI